MRRMVVDVAALRRQVVDHQTRVSSLTHKLDDVNAQLSESRQQLRDSGSLRTACTGVVIIQ